jgi:hypothetical protein
MDTWGVIFLGVIALASLVQAVFVIGLTLEGRRLARRLDELQTRLDREIRPGLEQVARIARNFAEVSDLAVLQVRRLDDLVEDTVEKIEEATGVVRRLVLRPLGPVADVLAFLKGLRRGIAVYRQLSGFEPERRAAARRYAEDEHLFI